VHYESISRYPLLAGVSQASFKNLLYVQKEMVVKGKMHGYMRMYWGRKILEWTKTPEEAFRNALYLNNKYELDGRDPNGFTVVTWCFGKHDRHWGERKVPLP
jgi:deoxyribodipyrimidine photo-lyase